MDNNIWWNQQLLFWKDKIYGTNNTLELYLNTNTQNFKYFNSPSINLGINNDNKKYFINFNYIDIKELRYELNDINNNIEKIYKLDKFDLYREFNKRGLKILFKLSKSKERACIITIILNESDYINIVVPYIVVESIYEIFTNYLNNYLNIISGLNSTFISSNLLEEYKNINKNILTLNDKIDNLTNSIESIKTLNLNENNIKNQTLDNPSGLNNNFNTFLETNIDKIYIPEIDDDIKEKLLENNIFNYNSIDKLDSDISSLVSTDYPVIKFYDNLNYDLNKLFPGYNITDILLHQLLGNFNIKYHMYNLINKKQILPTTYNLLKFNLNEKDMSNYNIDLSKDLLNIILYYKDLNKKLSTRESDPIKNKSVFILLFRNIIDPLCFSFIHKNINIDSFVNSCHNRMKNLYENNYFQYTEDLLKNYNLESYNLNLHKETLSKFIPSLINVNNDVNILYEKYLNSNRMFIPLSEIPNIEHKLKYIIDITINKVCSENNNIEEILDTDDNLSKYFLIDKKEDDDKLYTNIINKNNNNNLYIYIENLSDQIPYNIRQQFLDYIKNNNNEIIDISSYNLLEFNEKILKVIYIWNNYKDKIDINSSYKKFYMMIETFDDYDMSFLINELSSNKIENNDNWYDNMN